MNGFVNTILSVMLSWIRALINNLWSLFSSEDGGALYQFLSSSWLIIVIVLCAVCMLVDVIVYFFRWRPDYVWAAKWRRLRRKRPRAAEPAQEPQPQEALYTFREEAGPEYPPAAPTMAYAPLQPATAVYAPVAQPTQTWQAMQEEDEPVFDDAALWETDEPADIEWPADEQPASYGMPKPEPLDYFRDVQAGFAPAVPPQELYAPSASYQPPVQPEPEMETTAVHPGLDEETFRQSVGLEDSAPVRTPVMHAPVFRPFTVTHEPEEPVQQNAFQRFAQRAREFVAMDENDRKTIRDLQSTVDVSKAFHEPVYPQSFDHDEE